MVLDGQMEIYKQIKTLSVNQCWRGRRFKTPEYKAYEKELLYTLPNLKVPEPPYKVTFVVGFSNRRSDIDNFLKPLIDIMQKKYGFDDKDIYELYVKKVITKKGSEYFNFLLESINYC